MLSRYVHCVYHNLALGLGPLRAIMFRDANDADLRQCRHGCEAEETLEHVLCDCRYVQLLTAKKILNNVLPCIFLK